MIVNYPWGTAYHPQMNVLLVCEQPTKHIKYLHATDLTLKKQVAINNATYLYGISVLSCGSLVISGYCGSQYGVGVYTTEGVPQSQHIHQYNDKMEHVYSYSSSPFYTTVDNRDDIYVSDQCHQYWCFIFTGCTWQ